MRKLITIFLLMTFGSNKAFCVLKTWTGLGGNKLWSNAANWSTPGAPVAADDVLVNISDSIEVNQAVTINSLTVTNNSTVIFSVALTTSRRITLTSTSLGTLGLLINAGSTVYIQSTPTASTLTLRLDMTGGAGVTGEIYGNLIFRKSGNGIGGTNNQLVVYTSATQNASLVVKSTGLIKYEPGTDNTDDNTAMINISFENGSVYWVNKNGGSFPNGFYASTSLCRSTGMGVNGPTFNTSVYGNLEWDNPGQTSVYPFNKNLSFNNVNIINDGSGLLICKSSTSATSFTIIINGNLTISNGTALQVASGSVVSPNGATVQLHGNLINNGTLYSSAGSAGTINNFDFVGAGNQNISGTGLYNNELVLRMNGTAGVTLLNDIYLENNGLALLNGKINTGIYTLRVPSSFPITSNPSNWYTNLNAAGHTNFGTENSYIIGKFSVLGLSGATKIAFPVGSASAFRPIFLNNVSGNFTVEYFQSNPQLIGTNLGVGLDHISFLEYWNIDATGLPSANVELTYYDPNSGGVTNMNDLRIARYTGTIWNNIAQLPPVLNTTYIGTPGTNGSIISATEFNFGPVSLASSTVNNPLPAKDIQLSFLNSGNPNSTNLIWYINADDDVIKYHIEVSTNGIDFRHYGTKLSNQSRVSTHYVFSINDLNDAKQYYRVKVIFQNQSYVYSNILTKESNLRKLVSIYPNPVKDILKWNTNAQFNQYKIIDKLGNTIVNKQINEQQKSAYIPYLLKGMYVLQLINNRYNIVVSIQFTKE